VQRLVASGGVAVVTDAEIPGARYRLRADGQGRWQLEPLGAMVTATGLAAVELADLGALLADAKAPPVELPPRPDVALSDEPFEEDPWALLVRLLAPVEVVNSHGQPAPFERAKALELVAWLAQHRAPLDSRRGPHGHVGDGRARCDVRQRRVRRPPRSHRRGLASRR